MVRQQKLELQILGKVSKQEQKDDLKQTNSNRVSSTIFEVAEINGIYRKKIKKFHATS